MPILKFTVDSFPFEGFATCHSKKRPPEISGADAEVLEDRSSRETRLYNYHHVTKSNFERGTAIV
jgi:hypothetical protein